MTVCIAARCDGGKSIVVGADREITASGISLKFDHAEKKIDELSPRCCVLASGDALLAGEIFLKARGLTRKDESVLQAAERVKSVFMENHLSRVEDLILKPLGFKGIQDWRERAKDELPLSTYERVHGFIWSYGIRVVEFLIAGVDEDGAHIFRVFYEGMSGGNWIEWGDKIGYRAIGSGMSHAFVSLSIAGQHSGMSVEETLHNVCLAKTSAELAPGVGREDDFAVISSTGIRYVKKSDIILAGS